MVLGDDLFGAVSEAAKQLKALGGFDGIADIAAETDQRNRQLNLQGKGVGGIDYSNYGDRNPFAGTAPGQPGGAFGFAPQGGDVFQFQPQQTDPFGGLNAGRGDPFAGTTPGQQADPFGFYTDIYRNAQQSRDSIAFHKQRSADAQQKAAGNSDYTNWGGNGDPAQASGLPGTEQWRNLMDQASSETGTPWQVLAAIMAIESGGNPDANGNGEAFGLMQITKVWDSLVQQHGGNYFDPWTSIRVAAQILQQNYQQYGSWEKAAAAYFGGAGAFNDDGSWSDNADSFGTNIGQYVSRFNNNMAALGYGQGATVSTGNPRTDQAVSAAQSAIGTAYVWGGESYDEGGFDCSGLVQWAFAKAGIALPRLASQQVNATQTIDMSQAQAGDLLFFQFPPEMVRAEKDTVNHVAIYLGNGMMLQASTNGGDVHIREVDDWYMQYFVKAGRVPMGADYGTGHTGVDAPTRKGAHVNAVRDGYVLGMGDDPDLGHYVAVFDGSRFYTYGHLDHEGMTVKAGDYLKQGDTIAKVGMTGKTSGPHVHLDIHDLDGKPLDPFNYI